MILKAANNVLRKRGERPKYVGLMQRLRNRDTRTDHRGSSDMVQAGKDRDEQQRDLHNGEDGER